MKPVLSIVALILLSSFIVVLQGQKLENIYFNLYTDSLKKGTYNYINVDGKYTDGRWLPLTAKQVTFSSSAGKFEENSLFIDKDFKDAKVIVTAVLKTDTSMRKTITIYIKKNEDNERLKTQEEILKEIEQHGKSRKRKA